MFELATQKTNRLLDTFDETFDFGHKHSEVERLIFLLCATTVSTITLKSVERSNTDYPVEVTILIVLSKENKKSIKHKSKANDQGMQFVKRDVVVSILPRLMPCEV